jgi:hypothetical protein
MVAIAAAPILSPALAHSHVRLTRRQHARQNVEPALLTVVQTFVERLFRIGQALECSPGIAQGVGLPAEALDRIARGLLIRPRRSAIVPRFGKLPQSRLEGRPIIRLFRREPQARFQRGEARIREGSKVFLRRLSLPAGLGTTHLLVLATHLLLGIDGGGARDCDGCRSGEDCFPHSHLVILQSRLVMTIIEERRTARSS